MAFSENVTTLPLHFAISSRCSFQMEQVPTSKKNAHPGQAGVRIA